MFETILYTAVAIFILVTYWWNENKYRFFTPTHNRKWRANQQELATAVFNKNGSITLRNIRDTEYTSFKLYTPKYFDKVIDANDIVGAKIYTAKLNFPGVHMFTSFTFVDGTALSVSIQMRRHNDTYGLLHTLRLFCNPSELIYILLTHKDAITLNKEMLKRKMHMYTISLSRKELARLFEDILRRVNQIAAQPEFYSIFSNNCITNVLNHVNAVTSIQLPQQHYSYFATQHLGKLLQKKGLVRDLDKE